MGYLRWWRSPRLPFRPATIHRPSGSQYSRSAAEFINTLWLRGRDRPAGLLREFADFIHQYGLGFRCEEADATGIESARFVAALPKHSGRRHVAESVVAVGGEPEIERADGFLDQVDIIPDDLTGEA